ADAFHSSGQPQIFDRETNTVGSRAWHRRAAKNKRSTPGMITGNGDVQWRFQDALQFEGAIEFGSWNAFELAFFPGIYRRETAFVLLENLQRVDHNKIPRLHQPD